MPTRKDVTTRREFIRWTAASLCLPSAVMTESASAAAAPSEQPTIAKTGSDLGSLFPLIQSQAMKGEFPLSYLQSQFKGVAAWKRRARGKLLELLNQQTL